MKELSNSQTVPDSVKQSIEERYEQYRADEARAFIQDITNVKKSNSSTSGGSDHI